MLYSRLPAQFVNLFLAAQLTRGDTMRLAATAPISLTNVLLFKGGIHSASTSLAGHFPPDLLNPPQLYTSCYAQAHTCVAQTRLSSQQVASARCLPDESVPLPKLSLTRLIGTWSLLIPNLSIRHPELICTCHIHTVRTVDMHFDAA